MDIIAIIMYNIFFFKKVEEGVGEGNEEGVGEGNEEGVGEGNEEGVGEGNEEGHGTALHGVDSCSVD